jgi:SAM-dependent methyltransferase
MSRVGTENEARRDAWVHQRLGELPAGWRVLDAGAGQQKYRPSCNHVNYVAQDFAEYRPGDTAVGLHSEKWDYRGLDIVCDILAIPEPAGSFDAILCTEVFEHLPDPLGAVREFARLLRPGGKLLLTAPFTSLTHFAPFHYATGFNRYFYDTHLPACGFQIDELSCNGNYFELIAQELRRVPSVASQYAGGRARFWERWAMRAVLRLLGRFSRHDCGSHELGCYGLHVVATRLKHAAQAAA